MSGWSVGVLVIGTLVGTVSAAVAERLPVKAYTVDNGLAHNRVKRIVQDSRGFLWFCTADGLSRFDGVQFTNYQVEDSVVAPSINDLLETRDGIYWVATNSDGVFRFDPRAIPTAVEGRAAQRRFIRYPVGADPVTNRVNVLYRDASGTLWAGTDGGLFAMHESREEAFRPVPLGIPSRPDIQVLVWALVEDRAGSLWIATRYGLVRRTADGVTTHVAIRPSAVDDNVSALVLTKDGTLWVGHRAGLLMFRPDAVPKASAPGASHAVPSNARLFTTDDGLNHNTILGLQHSRSGSIWIRTFGAGLLEFDGRTFRAYETGPHVSDAAGSLTEDREGNLWVGSTARGAFKVTKHGWTAYGPPEGLGPAVSSVFESSSGELYASSSTWLVSRLDRGRFTTVRPGLPAIVTDESWRDINNVLQDRAGDWWIATRAGLYRFVGTRFEELARTRPTAVYTARDGLAHDDVSRVFEDSRGDIWVASWLPARDVVVRWDRATGTLHRYSERDGLRPFTSAIAFAEDRAGNVWIGLREGGLARYRDGRFTMVEREDGRPVGAVNGIYRDPAGRIWAAASRAGLYRLDTPDAERPRAIVYGKANGLISDNGTALTGDLAGRIYVGQARGVDRLDPDTGAVKHYSTADGLTGGEFKAAVRDERGALWFATTTGLLRLIPEPDEHAPPPPVFISALQVAGTAHPLSALGEREVSGLELNTGDNNIQIDFFAVAVRTGESLRYEYKLEGAATDWSAASAQRSVNFANLAPGAYRFLVRAVGTDGARSRPATVGFDILPPLWRRWWFLALAISVVTVAIIGLARVRYRRLQALRESENRFRTLAETASDAIITIDEDSRIVLVNRATEHVFGYTREELIGAELTMLMPESLRGRHREGLTRYARTGTRNIRWAAIELPGRHKDGHEVPLELSFGEFTRNGKRFFTGIARDITERRRAEDALRRSREERLAELERVRRRIATDLHDDIGSSLTRVSLLGEVVRQRVGAIDRSLIEPLSSIVTLSRELVDSMSDIVWAINPNKDHLSDLSQRMRHFASDVFTARQVEFRFRTPDPERDISVGANVRRELFLVFKEAVNNLVRHSGCSHADLEFRAEADRLVLVVSDNGCGFDPTVAANGHGLVSMRERVEGLGGRLEVVSRPGDGTLLTCTIPLAEHPPTPSARPEDPSPHEYAVTTGTSAT